MKNYFRISPPMRFCAVLILMGTVLSTSHAQNLKPEFGKAEYIELLKIAAQFGDSAFVSTFPAPQEFKLVVVELNS
ncbi:MAG: hypothetical protein LH606_08745 [Cytophagaceae bacterium]|nr:hypothetical protein [Cytophagaceae bacterium]